MPCLTYAEMRLDPAAADGCCAACSGPAACPGSGELSRMLLGISAGVGCAALAWGDHIVWCDVPWGLSLPERSVP